MTERTRRTREQWLELFQRQSDLQLNIADFCRQENLNDKYYSKRKKELLDNSDNADGGFIKLSQKNKRPLGGNQAIIVQYHQAQLQLPPSTDHRWVAGLLKSLT